jgi:5-methylcytosine-specific restriction endonuclease McrA
VPEAEDKIRDGSLTLSVAAKVKDFLAVKKLDPAEVLSAVEGKSFREVERILQQLAPDRLPRETCRPVGAEHTEIRLIVDAETMQRLDRLKSRRRKKTYAALVRDLVAAEWEREKKMEGRAAATTSKVNIMARNVPEPIRRLVWRRDHGACTYVYPETGKKCSSDKFLEIDHIHPRALGGDHALDNLRLLCREHNLLMAAKHFGMNKIEAYRK